MRISKVRKELKRIQRKLGDVDVFFGSFYQDVPVSGVVVEDGYPLIYGRDTFGKPGQEGPRL